MPPRAQRRAAAAAPLRLRAPPPRSAGLKPRPARRSGAPPHPPPIGCPRSRLPPPGHGPRPPRPPAARPGRPELAIGPRSRVPLTAGRDSRGSRRLRAGGGAGPGSVPARLLASAALPPAASTQRRNSADLRGPESALGAGGVGPALASRLVRVPLLPDSADQLFEGSLKDPEWTWTSVQLLCASKTNTGLEAKWNSRALGSQITELS
ncbi:translation initiation factor IF-2-like [Leopardus geoffroyi]|uniref:translation initiation factor IF-2-like n=1 Tax=Leopardus geoffroyi TaxID=46844 RepID=UPI001E25F9DA|nr:translation initiation factor IF-2-like [Leopardus geoffroyi]